MDDPDQASQPDSRALLVRDPGLAALLVAGKDATAFLNAQATAAFDDNFAGLQMAALADPKGRVLVAFQAWRDADTWLLALAAGEVEWLCAYLGRFVFRSHVSIAPAPETRLFGVIGTKAAAALAAVGLPTPDQGQRARAGALDVLGLGGHRWLTVGAEMALADAARALAPHTEPSRFEDWKRARMRSNEVEIRADTRGRFLPQMLGLVERGAVSFRKGCYPGQEIIARTQHLGRVKRGLALFRRKIAPIPGATQETERGPVEVLDGVALSAGDFLIQAVAPLAGGEDSQSYNGARP